MEIKYAKRFNIDFHNEYRKAEVVNPWSGAERTFTYYFINKNSDNTFPVTDDAVIIYTPVRNIVCFSTTHLPYLELLNETEALKGFPTTSYISSDAFRNLVDQGKIRDLGSTNDINLEILIDMNPDAVIAFSMGNELGMIKKIEAAGIPLTFNADYLESDPLGRAEWIKFISLFFEKEILADSVFKAIEKSYLEIKNSVLDVEKKPTVFTGIVYGDTWFLPGGKNYSAIFFQDAGAEYLWSDNPSTEFLKLSFESVLEKAMNADFWLGMGSYNDRSSIFHADNRYGKFKAFKKGNIYNYTAKIGETGGIVYFESGYSRPDIILSDLVKILHPDKLPEHTLYYYKKLK